MFVAVACDKNGGTETPKATPTGPFELSVALTDPGMLDPAKITTNAATIIGAQVCDTLLAFDPRTGALKPGLAETWTVAPDARKVTFQLRPGVTFHNGRAVVAEDFVYSLSRLADPKTGSSEHFLVDKVAGYAEVRAGATPTLAGVKAPSPQTLEVELTEPFAEFPSIMSSLVAGSALPKEEVDKPAGEFAAKPVCTGPYQVEAPQTDEGIRLVRNDSYHASNGAFRNGGRGLADAINFRFVASDADAYRLLDEGVVDVSPVPVQDLAAAGRIEGRLSSGVNGHVAYIGLPVKKAPFDNADFRQALALSVDRRSIISGLLGDSRRTPTGLLPASAGSSAAAGDCAGLGTETADPQAAQGALGRAGVEAPTEMTVYLNSGGGHEQWLQKVADRWEEDLGIKSVLKTDDWQPYLDLLAGAGADGPFRLAWAIKYPSPESLLAPLFSTSSLDNFSRYSSAEFDAAMAKARGTVDDTQRAAAYAEAGRILCNDMPVIPIWFGQDNLAFGKGLTTGGGSRLDIFGDPILRELRPS